MSFLFEKQCLKKGISPKEGGMKEVGRFTVGKFRQEEGVIMKHSSYNK